MSELRTHLQAAANAHHSACYPGDLAADLEIGEAGDTSLAPVGPRARRKPTGLRRFCQLGVLGVTSAVAAATALVLWSRVSMLPLTEPEKVWRQVAERKLPEFRVPPVPGLPRSLGMLA